MTLAISYNNSGNKYLYGPSAFRNMECFGLGFEFKELSLYTQGWNK